MILKILIIIHLIFVMNIKDAFTQDTNEKIKLISIVAIVNDEPITMIDLDARFKLIIISSNLPNDEKTRKNLYGQVIQSLINEILQSQEAKKLGIRVTNAEIEDNIRFIEIQNNLRASSTRPNSTPVLCLPQTAPLIEETTPAPTNGIPKFTVPSITGTSRTFSIISFSSSDISGWHKPPLLVTHPIIPSVSIPFNERDSIFIPKTSSADVLDLGVTLSLQKPPTSLIRKLLPIAFERSERTPKFNPKSVAIASILSDSIPVIKFETSIPLLFIVIRVPNTLLPPIVTTSNRDPKASEIASISSFGIPGGMKVNESLVAQKTPEYGLLKISL